uniref:Protein translocase subunit SecA n=1 Tax=Tetraselmis sp. GSL018 TaxID=582737 RepID=A0A061SHA1_9CHLO|mmetsp:Transcript_29572/g.70441  ORF Transcript_29572/g.70441 Transcript_29572/m.70441 type:complete len:995 (+) Transcript_29572:95-3079(+)|eukprot:CAMPEP_0177579074 /NCGR_PEP_ID=MMETSP0419_2-20121207/737_1 /TAXON_ID=582737 /ORGANISM="Tetraselmis sp., Strain GSL018" /LENGTH=994 /DNA_ID=CAMNT_0019067659 /DNA_START=37 /DNA_END=3021 /DNA_ORIENTATION=-
MASKCTVAVQRASAAAAKQGTELRCRSYVGRPSFGATLTFPFSSKKYRARSFRTGNSVRVSASKTGLLGSFNRFLQGNPEEKTQKEYKQVIDSINGLSSEMAALDDDGLRLKTAKLRERAKSGELLDSLLPEAFAVVREASDRVLGLRPFDTQLVGGAVLHSGKIAEMRTGEGKTLVAVLPAFLNALSGKGVHVVTVNDYLARRDSEWVGQVHRFLGLSVGLVQAGLTEQQRRDAYNCDVTYVTNSELGFDYLRDNLAQRESDLVLRDFNYCIIDEVDSILIDEARTPLIISGQAEAPSVKYYKAAKIADAFVRDVHYTVEEKQKNIILTEDGYEAAEDILQVSDLYDPREQWASYIINALKAKELQLKDVNYIVKGGEVIIVDEFTGRTMPGRRWSEGLHQAVEAKEGLEIQNETVTLASVSYQNFFRSFPKLAGMTGTAATEAEEFKTIYNLEVQVVPPNRTVKRTDHTDVVMRAEDGKWRAVVTEIVRMHKMGRPVLVGTTSVEKSELVGSMLEEKGIPYQLLNAKPENVERESEIIAQSGRLGFVTIATNMAGRGTDILLGGNPEFMARLKLRELLMPELVSLVDESNSIKNAGNKWKVRDGFFPVELSGDAKALARGAVEAAVDAWGKRQMEELEAEDRLSFACEKAPTADPVIMKIREAFRKIEAEYKVVTDQEKKEVVELGGLHVVGTERHESRRIDNQLRGRAGRQGDPGSTRYFLSLEDNLFRIFGGNRIQNLMSAFRVDDLPIESDMLTRSLNEAQRKVEAYFFDIRKQLNDYDEVLNTQRQKVYADRRKALCSSSLEPVLIEYAEKTADDILEANVDPTLPAAEWALEALAGKFRQYCYLLDDLNAEKLQEEAGGDFEQLRAYLRRRSVEAYQEKRQQVDSVESGLMAEAERFFLLTQTDNLWKDHLQRIKFVQQAVGLRGYAQRDPLVEYKLEGYNLFVEMMANIRRNVIYNVYMFRPEMINRPEQQKATVQKQAASANANK